jgi:hypothetical protein
LPLSRFDPVLIEPSLSFVAHSLCFGSLRFCTAVRKSVLRSDFFGSAPFGTLPLAAEIVYVAHEEARR